MGNCIQIRATSIHEKDENMPQVRPKEETLEGDGGGNNGVKVKVLLTRAELEWLMAELKSGEKKLQEVLAEMSKERERENGRFDGWKPSLESIVECPEMLCFS
ncbi:hypothetical protein LUZ60_012485 [Juncus effusus]|nr:hypothetical protein LUZ60_012485 [Juncus effusus]